MSGVFFCPDAVREALARLEAAGYEARAVGGCVRDSLLGKVPHDWDIATAALPADVKRVFADVPVLLTGEQHGTVTVLLDKMPLEITTYRQDGRYSDGRRPDTVTFTPSLREDLARRDFTVNALAWSPEAGLTDCFGGQEDLQRGVIRCVGEPDLRFGEDALRILRALRFSAQLSFSIEKHTAESLRRNCVLLQKIAAERTTSELLSLLCGENVRQVLLDFPEVFAELLPELAPMVGFAQKTPYHLYDVYTHTACSVEQIPPDPALRLAMLLHDVGKPACFFETDGRGHFKGHPAESVRITMEIFGRMRLDHKTAHRVRTLIEWHDAPIRLDAVSLRRWLHLLGADAFFDLLLVKRADNLAQNLAYSSKLSQYDALEQTARELLARGDCFSLEQLAVTGTELIHAGIPAGKYVGAALAVLLDAVIGGACPNEKAALLSFIKEHPPILPPEFSRMPHFQIRQATEADLDAVATLYFQLNAYAERQPVNPCGWRNGFYPVRQTAADALAARTLWLLEADGILAGAVVLNHNQADAYQGGDWTIAADGDEVLTVHTLAVHPACSHRGAGKRLTQFALDYARETGAKTVRLDAFTGNANANALYQKCGFRLAGTVDLGLNVPGLKWFHLYEKNPMAECTPPTPETVSIFG